MSSPPPETGPAAGPSDTVAHASRPHLRALTGVRFLAALYVTAFHFAAFRTYGSELARSLVGSGFVAVSLFFVLSGFILSYTYCGGPTPRPIPRREFYVSRVARIYPVYALGLLLMAPFFVVAHLRTGQIGQMAVEAVAVLTLVQSHVPSLAEAWNPPAWSLSTEAFFYLVFPFIVPWIVSRSRAGALALGAFCWAISVGAGALYLVYAPDGIAAPTSDTIAPLLSVLKYNPVIRLPEFVIGIVLGRMFLDRGVRAKVAPHASWLSVVASLALLAVLAQAARIPYVVLHDGLLAPLFALLVLALAEGKGPVARALSTRSMTLLGEASYSLYILHVPVAILVHKALAIGLSHAGPSFAGPHGAELANGPPAKVVMVAVAVASSVVCFRTVEVPMRTRVRNALLGGHRGAVPSPSPSSRLRSPGAPGKVPPR